jgi:hypothetical protein
MNGVVIPALPTAEDPNDAWTTVIRQRASLPRASSTMRLSGPPVPTPVVASRSQVSLRVSGLPLSPTVTDDSPGCLDANQTSPRASGSRWPSTRRTTLSDSDSSWTPPAADKDKRKRKANTPPLLESTNSRRKKSKKATSPKPVARVTRQHADTGKENKGNKGKGKAKN